MAITAEQFSTMTEAEKFALFQKLQAARKAQKLTLKVSAKGAVSVYGMGKWPVTLYSGQWERLLESAQEIRDFIEANSDVLSSKE